MLRYRHLLPISHQNHRDRFLLFARSCELPSLLLPLLLPLLLLLLSSRRCFRFLLLFFDSFRLFFSLFRSLRRSSFRSFFRARRSRSSARISSTSTISCFTRSYFSSLVRFRLTTEPSTGSSRACAVLM